MRKSVLAVLIGATVLAGCGSVRESRLNPFNWFGRSSEVPVAEQGEVNPLIPKRGGLFGERPPRAGEITTPMDQITALKVERVPGGAIIRATGVDPVQGAYNVRLVPADEKELPVKGVLSYRLERALPTRRSTGPVQTREATAARRVTDQTLRGVRTIRVEAARNARAVRR